MIKWKELFTLLKIFFTIAGIQTLSSYFIAFFFFALGTKSAMIACLMGIHYMVYLAVPVLFSSFVLTIVYKYAIMLRKDIER